MFQHFSEFVAYIEALPMLDLSFQQKEALLVEAKVFVEAQGLIPQVPVVTITGTNGKGSTVKALAEILVTHGFNVSAFTSPHLISYTERFSYNLRFADEKTLLRLANKLAALIDLSRWNFFFILLFMHLLWCTELSPDCIILEVGIGGRLDPTNILDAALVILTQVALDHTDILGNTREAIGFEKMGLLRVGIPFICGDLNPPISVIEKAAQLHCRYYQIGKHFGFNVHGNAWEVWLKDTIFSNLPVPKLHLTSLSCALQAAKLLFPELQYTQKFMLNRLAKINLPGRYQQLTYKDAEFIIDVSHNPAAVEALATFLQLLPKKPMGAIFGIKATKDVEAVLAIMKNLIDDWYLVPLVARGGGDADALAKLFERLAIKAQIAVNVADAIQTIIRKTPTNIRIVAFGSFQVAGPVLSFVGAKVEVA